MIARVLRLVLLTVPAGLAVSLSVFRFGSPLPAYAQQQQRLLERYERVLLRNPVPGAAFDRYVQAYADEGRIGELRARLSKLRQDERSRWAATVLLAYVESRYGSAARAVEAANEAVRSEPNRWHGWLALATVMDRQRRYQKAADAYRKLLSLPDVPPLQQERAYRRLGALLAALGRLDDARALWLEFARQYAQDRLVQEEVAEELAALGYADDALRLYDILLQDARSAYQKLRAAVGKAHLLANSDRLSEAVDVLAKLLEELAPGSWYRQEALREILTLYQARGEAKQINTFLERWRKEHPDDLDVATTAADVLAASGAIAEAIRQYESLRERAPDEPRIARRLAQLYEQEGRYREARQLYAALAEREPRNAELWEAVGRCYWLDSSLSEEERRRQAVDAWANIYTRQSEDPLRAVRLADLLATRQLYEEAERYYRLAAAKSDAFEYVEYLARFLHDRGRKQEAVALLLDRLNRDVNLADGRRIAELLASFGARDALGRVVDELVARYQPEPAVRWELRWLELEAAAEQEDWQAVRDHLDELRALLPEVDTAQRIAWLEALVRHGSRMGVLEEELRRWQQQLQQSPSELAFAVVATIQLQLNEYDAMSQTLELAQQRYPQSVWLVQLSVQLYRTVGRYDLAAQAAGRVAELRPGEASGWLAEQVRLLRRIGEYEKALAVARRWRALRPADGQAHRAVIDLLQRLGRLDELDMAYAAAIRQVEDDPLLRLDYGKHLALTGRRIEAIEQLWQAFVQQEDDQQHAALAAVYRAFVEAGVEDEFVRRLEQWRADPERRIPGTLALARVYEAQQRLELAEREYRRVLLDEPRNQVALERLVAIHLDRGRYAQAQAYAEQLLRLRPGDVSLEARIAEILLQQGRVDQAQARWEAIVARAGERASQATLTLAGQLLRRGYESNALALLEARLRRDPTDWRARLLAATILTRQQRDQEALAHLEPLLNLPWRPKAQRRSSQGPPVRNQPPDDYSYWETLSTARDRWLGQLQAGTGGQVIYAGSFVYSGMVYSGSSPTVPDDPREGLACALTARLLVAERNGQLADYVQSLARAAGIQLQIETDKAPPVQVRSVDARKFAADPAAARLAMLALTLLGQEQALLQLARQLGQQTPPQLAWLACHITATFLLRPEPTVADTAASIRKELAKLARSCIADGTYERWLQILRHSAHPETAAPFAIDLAVYLLDAKQQAVARRLLRAALEGPARPRDQLNAAVCVLANAEQLPDELVDLAATAVKSTSDELRRKLSSGVSTMSLTPSRLTTSEYTNELLRAVEALLRAGRMDEAAELSAMLIELTLRPCWITSRTSAWVLSYPDRSIAVFLIGSDPIPPFPQRLPLRRYPHIPTLRLVWQAFSDESNRKRLDEHLARVGRENLASLPYLALARAIRAAEGGNLEAAAEILREAVHQSGDNGLRLCLVQVLANLGRHREALEAAAQIGAAWGAMYGLKWRAILRLALLLDDEDTARGAAQRLVRTTVTADVEVEALAAILVRLGLRRELATLARRPSTAYFRPLFAGTVAGQGARRAQQLLAEGKRDAALAVARRELARLARSPLGREQRARGVVSVLKNLGVLEQEIARLQQRLREQPGDRHAFGKLYLIYAGSGQQTQAEQLVREILQRRPYDYGLRYAYAVSLANQRRWQEAASEFAVLLRSAPQAIRNGQAVLDAFRNAGKLTEFRKLVTNAAQRTQFSIISTSSSLGWLPDAASTLSVRDPEAALELYRLALQAGSFYPWMRTQMLVVAVRTGKPKEVEAELRSWVLWLLDNELDKENRALVERVFLVEETPSRQGRYAGRLGREVILFPDYETLTGRMFTLLHDAGTAPRVEPLLERLRQADDPRTQLVGRLLYAYWLAQDGTRQSRSAAINLMRNALKEVSAAEVGDRRLVLLAACGLLEELIDARDLHTEVSEDLYRLAKLCQEMFQAVELRFRYRQQAVVYAVLGRYHARRGDRKLALEHYRALASIRHDSVSAYASTLRTIGSFLQWAAEDGIVEPVVDRLLEEITGAGSRSASRMADYANQLLQLVATKPENRAAVEAVAERMWQRLQQTRQLQGPQVDALRALLIALADTDRLQRLVRTAAENPAFVVSADNLRLYTNVLLAAGEDDLAADLYVRTLQTLSARAIRWPTSPPPRTPYFYRKLSTLIRERAALLPVLSTFGGSWILDRWLAPTGRRLLWTPEYTRKVLETFETVLAAGSSAGTMAGPRPGPSLSALAAMEQVHALLWLGRRHEALQRAFELIGSTRAGRTLNAAALLEFRHGTPFLATVAAHAAYDGRLEELLEILHRRSQSDPLLNPTKRYARFAAALAHGDRDTAERELRSLLEETAKLPAVAQSFWRSVVAAAPLLRKDFLRTLNVAQPSLPRTLTVYVAGRYMTSWVDEAAALAGDVATLQSLRTAQQQSRPPALYSYVPVIGPIERLDYLLAYSELEARNNPAAAIDHFRRALRWPSAGASGRFDGMLLRFRPMELYLEAIDALRRAGKLAELEQTLLQELEAGRDQNQVDAEPALTLALIYLRTDRAPEAVKLLRSLPEECTPASPFALLVAAAHVPNRAALACVEECYLRWPWAFVGSTDAVVALYDLCNQPLPITSERFRRTLAHWHELSERTDPRFAGPPPFGTAPTGPRKPPVAQQVSRSVDFFLGVIDRLWERTERRAEALKLAEIWLALTGDLHRGIRLTQDCVADPKLATKLLELLLQAESRAAQPTAAALEALLDSGPEPVAELIRDAHKHGRLDQIERLVGSGGDNGTEPAGPARRFLTTMVAAARGDEKQVVAFVRSLRSVLPGNVSTAQRAALNMRMLLALEQVCPADTLRKELLRAAANEAVFRLRTAQLEGRLYGESAHVLRLLHRLADAALQEELHAVCRELLPLVRITVQEGDQSLLDDQLMLQILRDPAAARLLSKHLLQPALEQIPGRELVARGTFSRWLRWARATMGEEQPPGISLAFSFADDDRLQLVWQISPYLDSQPISYATLQRPYCPQWLSHVRQVFLPTDLAAEPDDQTLLVLEQSSDGVHFERWQSLPARTGWREDLRVGTTTLSRRQRGTRWLRARLVTGGKTVAVSTPILLPDSDRMSVSWFRIDTARGGGGLLQEPVAAAAQGLFGGLAGRRVVRLEPGLVAIEFQQAVSPGDWLVLSWWISQPDVGSAVPGGPQLQLRGQRLFASLQGGYGKLVFEQSIFAPSHLRPLVARLGLGDAERPLLFLPGTDDRPTAQLRVVGTQSLALEARRCRVDERAVLAALLNAAADVRSQQAEASARRHPSRSRQPGEREKRQ